jgi:hypothetical protein
MALLVRYLMAPVYLMALELEYHSKHAVRVTVSKIDEWHTAWYDRLGLAKVVRNELMHTDKSYLDFLSSPLSSAPSTSLNPRTTIVERDKTFNIVCRVFVNVTCMVRIASHYYMTCNSMSTYDQHLKPTMTTLELFRVFALLNELPVSSFPLSGVISSDSWWLLFSL